MKVKTPTWWLLPVVLMADQSTKWLAGQFNLVQLNQGVAFGWGPKVGTGILIGVMIIVLGLIFMWQHQTGRYQIGLMLILAGGLSNLIDRLIWGGVRDFIPMIWWRNNLADVSIVLGLLILVWQTYEVHFLAKKNYV